MLLSLFLVSTVLLFAVCFFSSSVCKFLEIKLSKFKEKYFVYLANTCTNSMVKIKCYSEVNILRTSLNTVDNM